MTPLAQVQQLIDRYQFAPARSIIDQIDPQTLDKHQLYEYLKYKSIILERLGEYSEVIDLMESSILDQIQHPIHSQELNNYYLLTLYRQSRYRKCREKIEKALETFRWLEDSPKKYEIGAELFRILGNTLIATGDYNQAEEKLAIGKKYAQKSANQEKIAALYNSLGNLAYYSSDYNAALQHYQESSLINQKSGNLRALADAKNNMGVILSDMGEIDEAMGYYQEAYEMYMELGIEQDGGDVLSNLGVLYKEKGELKTALTYQKRSLRIRQEIQNISKISSSLANIGHVHYALGEFEDAIDSFEKALEIDLEIGNELFIIEDYYNLFTVHFEKDQSRNTEKYYELAEKIAKQNPNMKIQGYFDLMKAFQFQHTPRITSKSMAAEIYRQLLELQDLPHDLWETSLINLCELLFEELNLFEQEEILEEIKMLAQDLEKKAKTSNSFSTTANSLLIKSKIAIIELDIPLAQELLAQAEFLAEEKGLKTIAMMISQEHDDLLTKLQKWGENLLNEAPLRDRIQQAEVDLLFDRMIKKYNPHFEVPREEPSLFLILTKTGICLYSKPFSSELGNDQLAAGFISALNHFLNDLFVVQNKQIDRIIFEEYNLLIKQIEDILLVYAYRGNSYHPNKKLRKIEEDIKSKKFLLESLVGNPSRISHDVVHEIDKILDEL